MRWNRLGVVACCGFPLCVLLTSRCFADFTEIRPPFAGEASHAAIFSRVYGGNFTRVGDVNFSNGNLLAERVSDGDLLADGDPPGPLGDDDQVWLTTSRGTRRAKAIFASYIGGPPFFGERLSFGYMDGERTLGGPGAYQRLFEVTSVSPDGYTIQQADLSIEAQKRVRWARGGGPPLGLPYEGGNPRLLSSRNLDNADFIDHMVSYKLVPATVPPGADPNPRWVVMFEDILQGEDFADFDFNDLAVEITEELPPFRRWIRTGGGNWNDPNSWQGPVPNSDSATANFLEDINSDAIVTLNTPNITVNKINLRSFSKYEISGGSSQNRLVIAGSNPIVNVEAGDHVFSAPVHVNSGDGLFTVKVVGNRELLFTNNVTFGNAVTFTKQGGGVAQLKKLESNAPLFVTIEGGSVRLASAGGTSRIDSLFMLPAVNSNPRLDITNNALVIKGGFDQNTLRGEIRRYYNGGLWDGNGVTPSEPDAIGSSFGTATEFAVGYVTAGTLPSIPPVFGTVDPSATLLLFTRYGDTDLNGEVDLSDFNRVASNFGETGKFWFDGDFNYDGEIGLPDFNLLAGNFGMFVGPGIAPGPGGVIPPGEWARLYAVVPEPAGATLLLVAALLRLRRRRR